MKPSESIFMMPLERVIGFVFLVLVFPALIMVYLLLRAVAGKPVVITGELLRVNGTIVQCRRFRTVGPGGSYFPAIGRFLNAYGLDDLPLCWEYACGKIRFIDIYKRRW